MVAQAKYGGGSFTAFKMTAKNWQRQKQLRRQKQILRLRRRMTIHGWMNIMGDAEPFEKLEGEVNGGGDVGFLFQPVG